MVEGAAQPGRKGLLQLVIKRYQVCTLLTYIS